MNTKPEITRFNTTISIDMPTDPALFPEDFNTADLYQYADTLAEFAARMALVDLIKNLVVATVGGVNNPFLDGYAEHTGSIMGCQVVSSVTLTALV